MEVVNLIPRSAVQQEWSPSAARLAGLRYVVELRADVLGHLVRESSQSPLGERDELDALLVSLHEPLFTYPVVFRRLEVIKRMRHSCRILDYGCGAGYYSISLALAGYEVSCWDTNPEALACIEYMAARLGINTARGTLSSNYDAGLCINVLDHVIEFEDCLDVIEDALAPGAQLFLHADFQDDGVHVSGKEAVDRAFRAIATRFAHSDEVTDWLQIWHRRPLRSPSGDGLVPEVERLKEPDLRPTISKVVELEFTEDGGVIVTGKVFYVSPCRLANVAARILLACDGTTTMRELIRRMKPFSMSGKDIRAVVAELWDRHIVVVQGQSL